MRQSSGHHAMAQRTVASIARRAAAAGAIAALVLLAAAPARATTAKFNQATANGGVAVDGTRNGGPWGGTGFAGTFDITLDPGAIPSKGYCVDLTHTITGGTVLPQVPVDYPAEVLFILNNAHPQANTIGTPLSPVKCEAAAVQCAIWHYTDNVTCTASDPTSTCPTLGARAAEIVTAAAQAAPLLATRVPQAFSFSPTSATNYLPGDVAHSVQASLFDDQGDPITNQAFLLQVTSGPGAPASTTGSAPLTLAYSNAGAVAGTDVITASISYTIPTGQKFKLPDKQGIVLAGSPITGALTGTAGKSWVTPQCGNTIVEPGEQCDDGNQSNSDDCTTGCRNSACGDGYVDLQGPVIEECDDGNQNNNDDCVFTPVDHDHNASTPAIACAINRCGDQFVNPAAEECDDGNTTNADGCTNDCHLPRCGDGIVQSGEACDDGDQVNDDECSNACTTPICGDGIVQPGNGEACDDGNASNQDDCRTICQPNVCGDGLLDMQPPVTEQCDDGNQVDNDGCSNSCHLPSCGDGITQPQTGEECDDGNQVNDDACSNGCRNAACGDGIVQAGNGEACDDGNASDVDDCVACQPAQCGDGFVDAQPPVVEECDDGNQVPNDGCNSQCKVGYCGDGVEQPGSGEQCDDGNTLDGDGCSSTCQDQDICANQVDDDGDGLVDCDDANDCTCLEINPVCKHPCPAKIVFKPEAPDKFRFQVSFDPSNPNVDPATVKLGITLTSQSGIVFAGTLQVGDLKRASPRSWKFRDVGAIKGNPIRGGISQVTLIRKPQSGTHEYRINAQVHADFSVADVGSPTQAMTLQVVLGNDAFQKTATWARFRGGWKVDFR